MSTDPMAWPRFCVSPTEALDWVSTLRPKDRAGQKAVLTLRWLLNMEQERLHPGPVPTSISHFTPDEPVQTL